MFATIFNQACVRMKLSQLNIIMMILQHDSRNILIKKNAKTILIHKTKPIYTTNNKSLVLIVFILLAFILILQIFFCHSCILSVNVDISWIASLQSAA